METPEQIEIPGLNVGGLIGRGTQSAVYSCSRNGTTYVVKVPLLATDDPRAEARFRREAATLLRLSGAGIARVHALSSAAGRSYMVTDYLAGGSLRGLLARGPRTAADVVTLGMQLAASLVEIHRRGLVHRDIKPDNVLFSADGQPKLIDFGFALPSGGATQEDAVGTLLYASPEQTGILKRPVDHRSDLYSLGVVLFECCAGRPLFESANAAELVRMHALHAAPELVTIDPRVGPVLSAIVARLLQKDPDDRYQSAAGLLRDLSQIDDLDRRLREGAPLQLHTALEAPKEQTPLIGQDEAIALLDDSWRRVQAGRMSVALVSAGPGLGKTRIAAEALQRCTESGAIALHMRCRPAMPAFEPLKLALEAFVTAALADAEHSTARLAPLRALLASGGAPLRSFSPRVADLLGDGSTADVVETSQIQFYGFLESVMRALAQGGTPVALCIDDAHDLDEGTSVVIGQLVGAADVPLWILLTANPEGVERLRDICGAALDTVAAGVPLTEAQVASLVETILGAPAEPRIATQIARGSAGNPMAVHAYVDAAVEQGFVEFAWGTWVSARDGIDGIEISNDVADLMLANLARLSPDGRELLAKAAVFGSAFSTARLAAFVEVPEDVAWRALHEGSAAHLVTERDGSAWEFVHERVRTALAASIDASQHAELHAKAARLLVAPAIITDDDLFAAARHVARSGDKLSSEQRYDISARAGERALETFAIDDAYTFLLAAEEAAIGGGIPIGTRVAEALGETMARRGQLSDAVTRFYQALELAPPSETLLRGRIRERLVRVHLAAYNFRPAREDVVRGFEELGAPPIVAKPLAVVGVLFRLVFFLIGRRLFGHRQLGEAERERFRVLSRLCEQLGIISYVSYEDLGTVSATIQSFMYARRVGPSTELARALSVVGFVLAMVGLRSGWERFSKRALKLANELKDPGSAAHVHSLQGITEDVLGDAIASEIAGEANHLEYGKWLDLADYMNGTGALVSNLFFRGYVGRSLEWYRRTEERLRTEKFGVQGMTLHPWTHFRAAAAAALGDEASADRHIEDGWRLAEDVNTLFQWVNFLGWALAYCIERGKLGAEADRIVQAFDRLNIAPARIAVLQRCYFVQLAYLRLKRLVHAAPENAGVLRAELDRALKTLNGVATVPSQVLHRHVVEGTRDALDGKTDRALAQLDLAERLARVSDSIIGLYEVAFWRAFVLRKAGETRAAQHEAVIAQQIAAKAHWPRREATVRAEYQLSELLAAVPSNRLATTSSLNAGALHSQRNLSALLAVSLASTKSLDPARQSALVLDELVRVTGAERAFLFLCDDAGVLKFQGGREVGGADLERLTGYSSTVVQRVFTTRAPLVVSGTDAGGVIGSSSAVVQGLRSIMAVPMVFADQVRGVVYADTRVAKGLFTEDDAAMLTAMANHIAVSLEMARTAKLEIERAELDANLALTGRVQHMFLPRAAEESGDGFRIAALYRSADQSGGDCWWMTRLPDGALLVLVGDVTGHGVASAMVAGLVTGIVREHLQGLGGHALDVAKMMGSIHRHLNDMTRGEFSMTQTAVVVDPKRTLLRAYFAAGLPVFLRQGGAISSLQASGDPLGQSSDMATIGIEEVKLTGPAQVLIFSDGIIEQRNRKDREFGARRLAKIWDQAADAGASGARDQLARDLESYAEGAPRTDDWTAVFVDLTSGPNDA